MDIKWETDKNTDLAGDFNIPLSLIDRSSRQNSKKERAALDDTLYNLDLIDIYRAFHLKAAEYTYFQLHMEYFLG